MTGLKSFLLGSVSDHVLHYATCSVLIVRQREENLGQAEESDDWRVLLAYDHSVSAKRAVEFSESLPFTDGVKVDLLTVQPLIRMFRQDIRLQLNDIYQASKQEAQRELDKLLGDSAWKTTKVECHLVESDNVAEAILKHADETDCDLIILGNKGLGAVKRFLLSCTLALGCAGAPEPVADAPPPEPQQGAITDDVPPLGAPAPKIAPSDARRREAQRDEESG
jgi:nucleotide-binding universal stress UspA family protein